MNASPANLASPQGAPSRHDVLDRLVAARLAASRVVEVLPSDVLVGQTVRLRRMVAADREAFVGMLERSREDVSQHMHLHLQVHTASTQPTWESSAACFDRLLALTAEGDATGQSWRRVITLHNNHPVGMVHILAIDRALECKGDIGWWMDTAFRGAGLATQAVLLATKHALRPLMGPGTGGLGLQRVVAAIRQDNEASRRVAAKAGYLQDANSTCGIHVNGVWKTHELWHADAVESPG